MGLEEAMRGMPACGRRPSRAENSETERILTRRQKAHARDFCFEHRKYEQSGRFSGNDLRKREWHKKKKDSEGCEVRTRADNRPDDLKSPALDHSANPPIIVDFLLPQDRPY